MQLPWEQTGDAKVARVWCVCFRNREERDDPGGFLTSDCRGNLIRLQQEFEEDTGLHLRAGTEPEMMWLKLNDDGTPSVEGVTKPYCYHIDQFSELQPIINRVIDYGQKHGPRHDPGRPRGRARPDRAQLRLRPRGEDGGQPLHLPPDLQAGRTRARRLPLFHAEAVHGRLGQRLPPQHLHLAGGRERLHARDRGRPEAGADRPLRHRRHPGAPAGSDRPHLSDDQLVPAALGHGLLGPRIRRLGLSEPHDRAARLRTGPLRVPGRRFGGEPVPLPRESDRGDAGRHRAQARSGRARGAQHLRGDGGRQGGQAPAR